MNYQQRITMTNPRRLGDTSQRIDVESIYREMREAIDQRVELQREQDGLWALIQRTHSNYHPQMQQINTRIGKMTHRVNELIAKLCQYRKTHKAMSLAYSYLGSEIERINKIIRHQEQTIQAVRSGRSSLISSTGHTHTDPTNLQRYVGLKRQQVGQLTKWRDHVSRYM